MDPMNVDAAGAAAEASPPPLPKTTPASAAEATAASAKQPGTGQQHGKAPGPSASSAPAGMDTATGDLGPSAATSPGADAATLTDPSAQNAASERTSPSPPPAPTDRNTSPVPAQSTVPVAPGSAPLASGRPPLPISRARSGSAAGDDLPLSLQRKQRQRRPPAGWEPDAELPGAAKRLKVNVPSGHVALARATARASWPSTIRISSNPTDRTV